MTGPGRALAAAAAAAALLVVGSPHRSSAVTITPTSLFMSSREPATSFRMYNGDPTPVEIELALAFGYPESDSLGAVDVRLTDVPPAGEPSAVAWLSLFPRRVVLQKGQSQVVRVAARPPAGLRAGEYWARLVVRARALPEATGSAPRPQTRIETEFVTAVNYRHGAVTTGIEVDHVLGARTDSTATLTLDLRRTGNAAWLGNLAVELRGAGDRVLWSAAENVAVYRTLRRVVTVPLPADGSDLSFRYRLSTDRPDLSAGVVVPAAPRIGDAPLRP